MTIAELILELQGIKDQSRIVILQKDAGGNGYSPLAGIDVNAAYTAYSTWSGDVGLETLTPELQKQGFTREDVASGEPCLVLYPTN